VGFSDFPKGGGFSGAGNLEGNESLYEEEEEEGIVAEYNNQDDEPMMMLNQQKITK
jgi:hypothetical protein